MCLADLPAEIVGQIAENLPMDVVIRLKCTGDKKLVSLLYSESGVRHIAQYSMHTLSLASLMAEMPAIRGLNSVSLTLKKSDSSGPSYLEALILALRPGLQHLELNAIEVYRAWTALESTQLAHLSFLQTLKLWGAPAGGQLFIPPSLTSLSLRGWKKSLNLEELACRATLRSLTLAHVVSLVFAPETTRLPSLTYLSMANRCELHPIKTDDTPRQAVMAFEQFGRFVLPATLQFFDTLCDYNIPESILQSLPWWGNLKQFTTIKRRNANPTVFPPNVTSLHYELSDTLPKLPPTLTYLRHTSYCPIWTPEILPQSLLSLSTMMLPDGEYMASHFPKSLTKLTSDCQSFEVAVEKLDQLPPQIQTFHSVLNSGDLVISFVRLPEKILAVSHEGLREFGGRWSCLSKILEFDALEAFQYIIIAIPEAQTKKYLTSYGGLLEICRRGAVRIAAWLSRQRACLGLWSDQVSPFSRDETNIYQMDKSLLLRLLPQLNPSTSTAVKSNISLCNVIVDFSHNRADNVDFRTLYDIKFGLLVPIDHLLFPEMLSHCSPDDDFLPLMEAMRASKRRFLKRKLRVGQIKPSQSNKEDLETLSENQCPKVQQKFFQWLIDTNQLPLVQWFIDDWKQTLCAHVLGSRYSSLTDPDRAPLLELPFDEVFTFHCRDLFVRSFTGKCNSDTIAILELLTQPTTFNITKSDFDQLSSFPIETCSNALPDALNGHEGETTVRLSFPRLVKCEASFPAISVVQKFGHELCLPGHFQSHVLVLNWLMHHAEDFLDLISREVMVAYLPSLEANGLDPAPLISCFRDHGI